MIADDFSGEYCYNNFERESVPEDADDPYRVGIDERDTFNEGDINDIYPDENHLSSDSD